MAKQGLRSLPSTYFGYIISCTDNEQPSSISAAIIGIYVLQAVQPVMPHVAARGRVQPLRSTYHANCSKRRRRPVSVHSAALAAENRRPEFEVSNSDSPSIGVSPARFHNTKGKKRTQITLVQQLLTALYTCALLVAAAAAWPSSA
jgi:hypothetical protein